jgi:site-specific DNA-methyltransferase (adenine-specific)
MTPYTLANQDAKVWLESLESHSADLVLTDPPYNSTQLDYENDWVWDDTTFALWWREIKRIAKPNAWILMFGTNPFTARLISSNEDDYRFDYVWVKSRKTSPLSSGFRPLGEHENVSVFNAGKVTQATYNPQFEAAEHIRNSRGAASAGAAWDTSYEMRPWQDNGSRYPTTVLYCPSPKRVKGSHPSAKPVPLLEYFVLTYSNPGDVVLDVFMGEGNTGVAAIKHDRRFVGCDKTQQWFARAEMKLEQQYAQALLFMGGV